MENGVVLYVFVYFSVCSHTLYSRFLSSVSYFEPNVEMMYFMGQNKKKEETKKKERHEKSKLKDVNMCKPSFDQSILNEQHRREKDAKAKERAQPAENAKFDMASALFNWVDSRSSSDEW